MPPPTLGAVASLVHSITKSVRCGFLDFSSAFDSVSRSLLHRKPEQFDCPKSFLAHLSDYFDIRTQGIRLRRNKSTPLANEFGVLQEAALSSSSFPTCISDLHCCFPSQLFALCQPRFGTEDFLNCSHYLSLIHDFFLCWIFGLLFLDWLTRLIPLSTYPLTRVDSSEYLEITIDKKLRRPSHVPNCVKYLRRLQFYIKVRHVQVRPDILFVHQCFFPLPSTVLSFLLFC